MNNIHDMGGMHGFGAIPIEEDEPVFHTDWEAKAMALTVAMGAWGKWNIDASRFQRESLGPLEYLQFTYYERWIAGLADLMVAQGLVTVEEIAQAKAAAGSQKQTPPLKAADVLPAMMRGGPSARPLNVTPRFAAGDQVRTSREHPEGHTRLPRYARGRVGTVELLHGGHVFPDSNSKFEGEAPQHLYTVRFTAQELWGPSASPRDSVTLDLWESYLEHA